MVTKKQIIKAQNLPSCVISLSIRKTINTLVAIICLLITIPVFSQSFEGKFFAGEGDVEYLELLDIARRMFHPDPEYQNISMLYTPWWNGFVEGPTWDAWWIQNSYGPTYCALPFYEEPYLTFLQNAQDLWFDQMGDGQRIGARDWVAPDGCLCDAARPGWIMYKQGDGRIDIHDWGMEFTAAGLLLQSELLLIGRDIAAIEQYLPKLERCANFIETRRDPKNDLFLAGAAGNLLAPSYAGWKRPDGSYGMAYLTGLSITYIAALDRLIELEKLAGNNEKATHYSDRQKRAREGLKQLTTDEGYFIKSLDPTGVRHGVYGAEKHGYFESSPNHDAIAFRVVDDAQAERIFNKIEAIPGLRRHHVIIPNEPGLDDMYDPGTSWLWKHGTWVNGGHWSTCEARMVLAYYRLNKFDEARRSMEHMLTFARQFRMDNPLVEFGSKVYQPKQPINLCYDSFGPVAALIRGLFEYIYRAESLTLIPHIPKSISRLEQRFPIRFGSKKLYLLTKGQGVITDVRVNGEKHKDFDARSVSLIFEKTPDEAHIQIAFGGAELDEMLESGSGVLKGQGLSLLTESEQADDPFKDNEIFQHIQAFYNKSVTEEFNKRYEVRHAALVLQAADALRKRRRMLAEGVLQPLPEPALAAADTVYINTVFKLGKGLADRLDSYSASADPANQQIYRQWMDSYPFTNKESDQY